MIPELGNFALILALCLACIQSFFPLVGAHRGNVAWMNMARPAAIGQFAFIVLSFFALMYSFVVNDFSVAYVAANSNTDLPLFYRVVAVWGAHEGSLLLWIAILGLWTASVAIFSKKLPLEFVARVLGVMGLVSIGFLLFSLMTSDPFQRLLPNIPINGNDLNALLQDPGLAFHPPTLYMGYVGFSVAFAFAIAALLSGKLDATWARWTRPWTLVAWCFLTLGITAGSWWSYRELGWGGWWGWDPVENASFMPWLVGTALLHSLAVSEKRDTFKSWTVLLAITAFSLSLLGTFLVRSGVLSSIHAFAIDPARGEFMLKFLLIVVGGSLLLYALRAPTVKSGGEFYLLSCESFLLLNNVLLLVAMATILLGTIYPLVLDALHFGKISVGPPYFDTLFIPLTMLLLFCMGIGPLCQWQQMSGKILLKRLRYSFVVSILFGGILPWAVAPHLSWNTSLALILSTWVIMAMVQFYLQQRKPLSRARFGMIAAHVGVAITVIGIALNSAYSLERSVRMAPGDSAKLGAYTFQFIGVNNLVGPNYTGATGDFLITRGGLPVTVLHAQNRIYTVQQVAMTEAAIHIGIISDLYIAMAEPLPGNAWAVRLYVKPFVRWIWAGGLLMLLGGLLAASDKRYFKK